LSKLIQRSYRSSSAIAIPSNEVGIICDIEGAESHMIQRELPKLRGRIKFLLLELHSEILGERAIDELLKVVADLGFVLKQRMGKNVFLTAG
jgi:hypothetical protein